MSEESRARLRGKIYGKFESQSAFARSIRWSQNKVSKLLNGHYDPRLSEVRRLIDCLDLSDDEYKVIFSI